MQYGDGEENWLLQYIALVLLIGVLGVLFPVGLVLIIPGLMIIGIVYSILLIKGRVDEVPFESIIPYLIFTMILKRIIKPGSD